MSKRTMVKNVETRVLFSSEEIIKILQTAARAPENAKGALYFDDEVFYDDLEIVWWEKIEEEFEE